MRNVHRIHLTGMIDPTASENSASPAPTHFFMRIMKARLDPRFENAAGSVDLNAVSTSDPFDPAKVMSVQGEQKFYDDTCEWLLNNPVRTAKLVFATLRPETIKRLSIRARRKDAFREDVSEWLPLSSLYNQTFENNTALEVEYDLVLDGISELELRASGVGETPETFELTFEVSRIDDDRRRLGNT